MENIVEFPTRDVRDWLVIERSMRSALTNVAPETQERLVEKMKAFWRLLDPEFQFSFDISFEMDGQMSEAQKAAFRSRLTEKISALSQEKINAFTKRLFIERLNREIDMCRELGLL